MKIHGITNSIFSSCTYILESDEYKDSCWLIDIGDIEPILEYIKNKVVNGVFITHTHYDHIYGIEYLLHHFPNCKIFTSEYGKAALYSNKLNFSKYHNSSIILPDNVNIEILHAKQKVKIFDTTKVDVIETPGHDPSCLTYHCEKYLFTGDSYIPNITVVTSFPQSNKKQAEESVQEIVKNLEYGMTLCPGHGCCVKIE